MNVANGIKVGDVVRYTDRPDVGERYTVTQVEGDGYVLIRSHGSRQVWRCSAWRLGAFQ